MQYAVNMFDILIEFMVRNMGSQILLKLQATKNIGFAKKNACA